MPRAMQGKAIRKHMKKAPCVPLGETPRNTPKRNLNQSVLKPGLFTQNRYQKASERRSLSAVGQQARDHPFRASATQPPNHIKMKPSNKYIQKKAKAVLFET